LYTLRCLSLALALLVAASAILLLSDWSQRRPAGDKTIRVAVFQFASRPTLDEGVTGIVAGLEEKGFREGNNLSLSRHNAESDLSTANAMARDMTDGRYDLIITVSTPALQAVANANQQGRTPHVFGIVTDPAASGVGIGRKNPLDPPPYMAGIGTFQPVEAVFRLAKAVHPNLRRVGVVWNPGEACSVACLEIGRAVSRELGMELSEATVDSSVGVREATEALISRGVQAIWIGGDNIVELAAPTLIATARRSGVPVFTNNPDQALQGAFFSLGAHYGEVGRQTGLLAGEILRGRLPASVPIENVVPPRLYVNLGALKGLREPWEASPSLLAKADRVMGEAPNARSHRDPLQRERP